MASFPTVAEVEAYIRQSAQARGIDPDIAVRVARSEGLNANPAEAWQSSVVNKGRREPSYTPFQLLVGGEGTGFPPGMGNDFINSTGLDPRNPSNWQPAVDFALNQAAEGGWTPWYGAAKAGVGRWDGVRGAEPQTVAMGSMSPTPLPAMTASASAPLEPGSPAPPLDRSRNIPTRNVMPVQAQTAAAPPPPVNPSSTPRAPSTSAELMALMGSMAPQQPQFQPVQIQGPSPQQANALSSFVAALKQRRMA